MITLKMTDPTNDKLLKKLDQYVNSIKKRERYVNSSVEKKIVSSEGGSYIGILYEIDIKGTTDEGDKETNLFVKNIIVADLMIFSVDELYRRELFAYRELSTVFDELQNEAKVPIDEQFKMAHSYEESNSNAIILENLAKRGFKTYFRTHIISFEFAKTAVKQIAKFHGLSFVIKEKKPKFFREKIEILNHPFKYDEIWENFMKGMIETSLGCLEKDVKDKYEKSIIAKVNNYPWYVSGDSCKLKTLCHGDFRHNNIMVKEVMGRGTEVIPVDYQIINFGNPVLDLLYLIFWGTDREFRNTYMENLKNHYYESLKEFLTYFKLDIEGIFSKKEFEKQYNEKKDFGVMLGVLFLPFLFPNENEGPNFSNPEGIIGDSSFKLDNGFKERFREIIYDFIDWGYLDAIHLDKQNV